MLKYIAAVVAAVVVIGGVVALHPLFKRYRVPSESMQPTIQRGEKVNLNRGEAPKVGDVVVFHPPAGAELGTECGTRQPPRQVCAKPTPRPSPVLFIKRIVAGPGDQIAFRSGHTIRNGSPQQEPFAAACAGEACAYPQPVAVPARMYCVVGDNRGASDDSRFWGPVPSDWIVGRVERCHALYFACSPVR